MTLLLALLAAAAPPIALDWPVACAPGRDCHVQNYVDDRPGRGVLDAGCGERSYDGHDGTDIRLPSMVEQRAGVAVRAAATGTVLRARNDAPDGQRIAGQECGNGVVIDHGGGWETQYCHMAQGSIAVAAGQKVAAGTMLGRIGLSGQTEFPHLHLTVRQNGKPVDPFAWGAPAGQCRGGRSLWRTPVAYRRGAVLLAGFAAGPVTLASVQEAGEAPQPRPARDRPLVAFVEAIGLEAGDVQRVRVVAPGGAVIAENMAAPLDRAKAQWVIFAGKKAPPGGWPAGEYRASYELLRGGKPATARSFSIRL